MAKLSSSDIALEGFRITRERPRILLAWSVLAFVFALISGAILVSLAGGAFMELRSLQASSAASASPDPQVVFALLRRLAPAYGIITVFSLVYYAVLYAAGNRAVLRPEDRSFGFLRLGKDELMQGVVWVLVTLLLLGVYVLALIPVALIAIVLSMASPILAGLVPFVAVVLVFCGLIWVWVRLSLTWAATFDTGRIGIGLSWRLTKGRFWPLFGAYVLAFVLLLVMGLLATVIIAAVAAVIGGGLAAVGGMFNPDLSSLAAYYTPAIVIQLVLWSVVTALAIAVMVCGPAYAYRQLRDESPLGAPSTFD